MESSSPDALASDSGLGAFAGGSGRGSPDIRAKSECTKATGKSWYRDPLGPSRTAPASTACGPKDSPISVTLGLSETGIRKIAAIRSPT